MTDDLAENRPPDGSTSGWQDHLTLAKHGDREALGEIFQQLRAYLRSRAVAQVDNQLQVKVSPSDIVQETLLEAHRGFAGFEGETRGDLVAWVQGILNHRVKTAYRKYRGATKRDLRRETGLHELKDSRQLIDMPDSIGSPSGQAIANEEETLLEAALLELIPSHEQVIRLRNELKLSFSEIGVALNCSEDAAQKLWTRAVKQLSRKLKLDAS